MSLISGVVSNETYQSSLDYQFNLSGGFGSGTNSFNVNIDIGKYALNSASFCSWDNVLKKITILESGKYQICSFFRLNASLDTALTVAKYDLELWINGNIVAYLYIHGSSGSVTFINYPYYNDSDPVGAGTGTTAFSVTSSRQLTANGYYGHGGSYDLQSGSEIYLKSYNTTANYSSPTRTAPEGSVKIQNLKFTIDKIK